jgi:prepilin-type processing-associated H-X9-DG protein
MPEAIAGSGYYIDPVLRCPSNDNGWQFYAVPFSTPGIKRQAAGGRQGRWTSGEPGVPTRVSEIEGASMVPLFVEAWTSGGVYSINHLSLSSSPLPDNGFHAWFIYEDVHGGKNSNIVFCDGSVRNVDKDVWIKEDTGVLDTNDWSYYFCITTSGRPASWRQGRPNW